MTFIPESAILDSISFAIQDFILPIGGMFNNFTSTNPDTLAASTTAGKYILSKDPIIYNPSNDTSDYYEILTRRLARLNPAKNFNPANILPVQLLAPNNSGYTVNYINRIVTKSGTVTNPVKATYSYKVVKVLTSWPEAPTDIVLPTIAINSGQFDGTTWEIGSELQNNKYLYYIEIWAGNNTQRSWLCSILEKAFRVDLPLIDFERGYPVLSNGSPNPSFDPELQRIRWLKVEKCRFTFLPNLDSTSTLEKARASGTLLVSLIV